MVGEVQGGKGFIDNVSRLKQKQRSSYILLSDYVSCFLIHLLQQPDLLITESSHFRQTPVTNQLPGALKTSNSSRESPRSSDMPLTNTPRKL